MKYQFPIISSIDQIREAIADKPEFIEAVRDDLIIFNYLVSMPDSFPPVNVAGGSKRMREERTRKNALLRECRGLVFSSEGELLSRRFHKFFNLGERPETAIDVDAHNFIMLQKLDGSMITPIPLNGGKKIRWGTKMGLTDVGLAAEAYVAQHPQYEVFAKAAYEAGVTPIFEFIAPSNRIVVPYSETKLVLLAMRNNLYGNYFPYYEVRANALHHNIPYVEKYDGELKDISKQENIEGAVIVFEDGHRVKVKCEWYVNLHKTKDAMRFEKDVLKLVLNNQIDDLLPFLDDNDRKRVVKYSSGVNEAIEFAMDQIISIHEMIACNGISRKDFAIKHKNMYEPLFVNIVFSTWDTWQEDVIGIQYQIVDYMMKQTSSQSAIDGLHSVLPFEKWSLE